MYRIAQLRIEKNMSQIALAMELNVSQKTISAYENGKSEPGLAILMKMAELFGTSVDYIIGYTDVKTPIDRLLQIELTEKECAVLNRFRELSYRNQDIALGLMIGLANGDTSS